MDSLVNTGGRACRFADPSYRPASVNASGFSCPAKSTSLRLPPQIDAGLRRMHEVVSEQRERFAIGGLQPSNEMAGSTGPDGAMASGFS